MEISICIPAYKRTNFLRRLLESISIQTFKDFEVIITDDSNDASVEMLVEEFMSIIPKLRYYKNATVKGTPENWNEAIRKASGKWIKLMHDDDWFASEDALQIFYDAVKKHPSCSFFFCAYQNVLESGKIDPVKLSSTGKWLLKKSIFNLFKTQYIGNPSCTLVKSQDSIYYDSQLKWVVDFDFYIRYLLQHKEFVYIDKTLICVGLNENQVTHYTFRNREVELPENQILLSKFGAGILKNIFVYDYYWRMYRNLKIRKIEDAVQYGKDPLPDVIKRLVSFQGKIPAPLLFIGPFSKLFMLISYVINPKD